MKNARESYWSTGELRKRYHTDEKGIFHGKMTLHNTDGTIFCSRFWYHGSNVGIVQYNIIPSYKSKITEVVLLNTLKSNEIESISHGLNIKIEYE